MSMDSRSALILKLQICFIFLFCICERNINGKYSEKCQYKAVPHVWHELYSRDIVTCSCCKRCREKELPAIWKESLHYAAEDVQQGCCPSAVNIVLIADVPGQVSCYQNCPTQNFSRIYSATLKYL